MALTFEKKGKQSRAPIRSRVSLAPSSFENGVHFPDSLKDAIIHSLKQHPGSLSAAEQLESADFIQLPDRLEIYTKLSKTMLPIVFGAKTKEHIEFTLADIGIPLPLKMFSGEHSVDPAKASSDLSSHKNVSLERLKKSAAALNLVSDKLSKEIEELDSVLKKLNLGITTWVEVQKSSDEEGTSYEDFIGYVRFNTRWCISLRSGYSRVDGDEREEIWPFADAPRALRIKAVAKLPELMEKLASEAEGMVATLSMTVDNVHSYAESLKGGE